MLLADESAPGGPRVFGMVRLPSAKCFIHMDSISIQFFSHYNLDKAP
jgi:hypothetical protein